MHVLLKNLIDTMCPDRISRNLLYFLSRLDQYDKLFALRGLVRQYFKKKIYLQVVILFCDQRCESETYTYVII